MTKTESEADTELPTLVDWTSVWVIAVVVAIRVAVASGRAASNPLVGVALEALQPGVDVNLIVADAEALHPRP